MARLTEAQRRVLMKLRDAEDAATEAAAPNEYPEYEIVCEGIDCYIGLERTSWAVVYALLRYMAISDVSDGMTCPFRRFQINGTGRAILNDESQIDALLKAIREGGSWTWEDGKLVRI